LILDHEYINCFIEFVDNHKVEQIQTGLMMIVLEMKVVTVYNIDDKIDYSVDNTEIGDVYLSLLLI
jgi:hypothetical protein